jgi:hypothetical protein
MYDYVHDLPHNIEYINDNTVRKIGRASTRETVLFMETLCRYLFEHPDPTIVSVYGFCDYGRQTDGNYLYTYDMEKLYRLTKYEKKIVQAVADDWYGYGIHPSESKSEAIVIGRKEYPDLLKFLEDLTRLGRYTDLNYGNIMMNGARDYKIVDLEGFFHAPLNHSQNLWFQ